jgi:multimeric flavodoxin WrbA
VKVLGMSASSRVWGNTELLVRQALRGAEGERAETRFLRLTDLELRPCTGCMTCVFKDRDCVLDDGLSSILEALRWSDAVILGSPTYVLGATGVIKTLQDRLIRFGMVREFAGRPGLAVAAAGVPGWETFALPQLCLTFLFLGMPVVDQFVAYAQGPGEVLYDPDALARALGGGAALGRGEAEFQGRAGACPVCHFDLATVRADGGGHCPVCDLPGSWDRQGGETVFRPRPGAEPRWSHAVMRRHFQEKILPSAAGFRSRLKEIRARVQAFQAGEEP